MQTWTDPTIPITPSNVFERKKKTIPVARVIPVQREVLLGTGDTGETGEDKKLDREVAKAMADMETVVSEDRPSTSSPLPGKGCTVREVKLVNFLTSVCFLSNEYSLRVVYT